MWRKRCVFSPKTRSTHGNIRSRLNSRKATSDFKKKHVFVFSDFESVGDDEPTVVATARGTFNSRGGTLTSEETGVSICIPSGAIPAGFEQEIYFKVCKDNTMLPPLDADKGERSSFT